MKRCSLVTITRSPSSCLSCSKTLHKMPTSRPIWLWHLTACLVMTTLDSSEWFEFSRVASNNAMVLDIKWHSWMAQDDRRKFLVQDTRRYGFRPPLVPAHSYPHLMVQEEIQTKNNIYICSCQEPWQTQSSEIPSDNRWVFLYWGSFVDGCELNNQCRAISTACGERSKPIKGRQTNSFAASICRPVWPHHYWTCW